MRSFRGLLTSKQGALWLVACTAAFVLTGLALEVIGSVLLAFVVGLVFNEVGDRVVAWFVEWYELERAIDEGVPVE